MARELCQRCEYPISHCLCQSITQVSHQTRVIVLQHPSEVKNAKNTVRLLNLLSDNIEVIIGETDADFAELRTQIATRSDKYALLFPSEDALKLEPSSNSNLTFDTLVVIDGTWKKAKKILLLNPWLEQINKVSFSQEHQSSYQIRSTKVSGGLSTIEATAYALNLIENTEIAPFMTALDGLKHAFTKNMPANVKARYQK